MKNILNILVFSLITLTLFGFSPVKDSSISLSKGWKFTKGDDPAWSKMNADDSKWADIEIEKPFELQGYANYDGYVWYRLKVMIPSELKTNSYLKDSLQFILGKIDDCDQFYLNGAFIGENNRIVSEPSEDPIFEKAGFYGAERRYILSVSDANIRWDKENVLAVRVFDHGSNGGFFGSNPRLQMLELQEKKIIDYSRHPFRFEGTKAHKTYIVKNPTANELRGKFILSASMDDTQKVLFKQENKLNLKPGESKEFSFSFKETAESSTLKSVFRHSDSDAVIETSEQIPYILTPKTADTPQINGARAVGVSPGKPFLFSVPATGMRPMKFEAQNLPPGLVIDANSGIITGKVSQPGEYKVILFAQNSKGKTSGNLLIKVGNQLMLTPPMGWNSWNCWGANVSQEKVLQSARALKEKGLVNHGWAFINIDDGWEASRNGQGEILANEKFPDMKALGDSLHQMGLKFGIYSSPGTTTCGGYAGSYQHENEDAQTYGGWGIDYLKYDWCSYNQIAKDRSLSELKKPYFIMQEALANLDRDIVYSLCQYGRGNVWEWGPEVGGQLWRTTGDITDTWKSLSQIGFKQTESAPFAGPGRWNDPDMLILGWLGWGSNMHPTRLTVNEQYTHMSLWSLLSAPLLIGCDLTRLDDFTLNLLTNDEVLSIDQDPLGKQATPKLIKGNIQIWVKELEDGTKAIGIFNLGEEREKVVLQLSDIGIFGKNIIRDVWRQKDLGMFDSTFETNVGPHGVTLIKVKK